MPALAPATARARLAAARVGRLATASASGVPHLVPVVFALGDRSDTVYVAVDAKPKRTRSLRRLRNLAENPQGSLLVDHYAEDWSQLWWVRVDGPARILAPGDGEAARAVRLLADRYPQQTATGAVIALDLGRVSGWTASETG